MNKLKSTIGNAAGYIRGALRQNYTTRERINLVFSRLSHSRKVLNFQITYLDKNAYSYLLEEIFLKGEYRFEANTDSPVILDCGANIGLATLFFKHLYPTARITCFEADPTTASILRENVEQNLLQDVSVHNLMLSNTEGDHPFYVELGTTGSLLMSSKPDRLLNHREITVKAGKLSQYVNGPVDLLKLDVEGAELEVLTDLISSNKISLIHTMVIEYHHKIRDQASCLATFLGLLEKQGFEYQIGTAGCNPITRQGVFQDIAIGAYRRA